MLGATHAVIGMAAGMGIATYAGMEPTQILFLGGISALSALLPDIDHPAGSLRRQLGAVGHISFFWMKHRGVTHTLISLAMVSAVTLYFLPVKVAFAFIAGYGSHLLADMLTHSGVPLVYPLLKYRYSFGVMKTGGIFEAIIRMICILVIARMILDLI